MSTRGCFGLRLLAASMMGVLAVSAVAAGAERVGRSGALDRSFGRAGIVVTELRTPGSRIASVWGSELAIGPRGEVVAAGGVAKYGGRETDAWLLRYSSRGRLDRRLVGDLGDLGLHVVDSIAVQRDGRMLVGGGGFGGLFIRRFLANGRADTTFGQRGKVHVALGDPEDREGHVEPIVVRPDGRIVALVSWLDYPPTTGADATSALVRYEADGTLDRTFGVAGVARLPFVSAEGFAVAPDGSFVVAGARDPQADSFVVRMSPHGVPDTSFGSAGRVVLGRTVTRVLAGRTGAVVVGDWWLARLTTAGRLDPRFGQGGFVTLRLLRAADAALQRNGAIVVAGWTGAGKRRLGAVVRLRANGKVDETFGRRGKATLRLARSTTSVESTAIQSDGQILVGASSGTRFGLARYHG